MAALPTHGPGLAYGLTMYRVELLSRWISGGFCICLPPDDSPLAVNLSSVPFPKIVAVSKLSYSRRIGSATPQRGMERILSTASESTSTIAAYALR